jgi:hypothetical protein
MAITKYDQFDFLIDIVPRDVPDFEEYLEKLSVLWAVPRWLPFGACYISDGNTFSAKYFGVKQSLKNSESDASFSTWVLSNYVLQCVTPAAHIFLDHGSTYDTGYIVTFPRFIGGTHSSLHFYFRNLTAFSSLVLNFLKL